MPIYEMEPPPGMIRFVIPYPDQRLPGRAGFFAWLRTAPTPEQAARQRHRTGVVFGWLFVIFLAWALGPHPLDEIARMASQPGFWTRLFIGVVEELL